MEKQSISKSVIWQFAGKFLLEGIVFFTTPIFTRLLSPSDFGYVSLYTSWLAIFGLIIGLQVNGSIGNARIKYGEEKLYNYLSSIMSISVCSFIILLFVIVILKKQIAILTGLSENILFIMIIHSFAMFVFRFEITRLDQLRLVEKSTILSLLHSILVIVLSLFFVIYAIENKGTARIYGQALPSIVFGIVILVILYTRGKCFWNGIYNRFCLSLTVPLIMHGLAALIFQQSDRLMLQKMHGTEILGQYSVAVGLCSVLPIIANILNTAWIPFYYDFKKTNKTEDIIVHSKRCVQFYTIISLGFIFLAYDVYKLMAPVEYYGGLKLIPFFCIAHYFWFLYFFPSNFEFFYEKTKYMPIATSATAFVNILINWLLIPHYGLIGAACGTAIAYGVLFIFHLAIAKYVICEEYEFKNFLIFLPGVFIVGLVCVILYFFDVDWTIRWGLASILAIYLLQDVIKHKSIF